jgi:Ca2+-binding EF-hand superfamily protein
MEITMWEKIKKWFGLLDLNKDGKVTAEDLELARALADKKAKEANEAINEVTEAVTAVKKVVKGRKKK